MGRPSGGARDGADHLRKKAWRLCGAGMWVSLGTGLKPGLRDGNGTISSLPVQTVGCAVEIGHWYIRLVVEMQVQH